MGDSQEVTAAIGGGAAASVAPKRKNLGKNT